MEKTLSEQLADNLRYYANGEINKRCRNEKGCFYSGESVSKETEGCFVGRLLTPEDRVKADAYYKQLDTRPSGVDTLVEDKDFIGISIPTIISENVDLMVDFQSLHDNPINWNYDNASLSSSGIEALEKIISDYCLDLEAFEEFLISK